MASPMLNVVTAPKKPNGPAKPSRRQKRTAGVLSFDGGGSKGVMELVVTDYVFKMATMIINNPEEMPR